MKAKSKRKKKSGHGTVQTQRTQHARSTNRHESTQARAHTDETRTQRKGGRKEEGKVKVVAVARQVGGCGNGDDVSGEGEGGTTVVVGSADKQSEQQRQGQQWEAEELAAAALGSQLTQ